MPLQGTISGRALCFDPPERGGYPNVRGFFSGIEHSSLTPCLLVFVRIAEAGSDRFYILTWDNLRDLLIQHHKTYLQAHDGLRPRRWDSLHAALSEDDLHPYQDKWDTAFQNLM